MAIVLWCIRKDSANFYQKIFIFKAPAIFWKWKLFRACDVRARGRNCRFFGIELLKIYLISRKVYVFKNPKKVLNHSTLVYSYIDYFLVGLVYSTQHFSCYRPAKNAILSNSLRHLNATTKKYLYLKIFYFNSIALSQEYKLNLNLQFEFYIHFILNFIFVSKSFNLIFKM